jgi:tetratricopeptide (TPR) repeat protein
MIKVAESYAAQNEWDRSNEAYRFLVKMDPDSIKAAEYQRHVVENWNSAVELDHAQEEIKVLLDDYGPDSAWAKKQKERDALARSLDTTDDLVRTTAKTIHFEAQRREKALKLPPGSGCATKSPLPLDLQKLYQRASDAYDSYLTAFGTGKTARPGTVEIRYYRADILCFKLAQPEAAGDEYLAVGKTQPVGEFHKPALLAAISAFELVRPKATGKHDTFPVDKKFGEAIDLYLTLFPNDPKNLIGVLFRYGQLFYDNGDYDEAIKRFGVIVTQYPDDPNAGPAGDRILSALNKAADYETIETWARKLKKAKAFADPAQQTRLDKLIVESIVKSGDKYADAGKFDKAAEFYLRVQKEPTADAKVAAQAMMNAGVMYEKAKDSERAAGIYLDLAEKYVDKAPDLAEKAAFSAGQVYEKVIYYDRAAKAYELVVEKFGKDQRVADALFDAAVLRQALGQNDKAIAHYQDYAKRFKERKDAPDVAFNIGVVYEDAGDDAHAYVAFKDYASTYRSSNKHVVEAWTRAGRTSYRLGQYKRAKEEFETAQRLYKAASAKDKGEAKAWAAEARYYEGELIFRDYEKVTLDVKPALLGNALKAKSKLLNDAKLAYLSVADYQDLKWADAALFRIGQVFEGYADALTAAANKPPAGITPDQVTAYQDTINGFVVQIQDAAVEAYASAYQKAIQQQVYDEYTAKMREALGRLASDKFPPEHEARSKERVKDRAPNPELMTEIAR